MTVTTIATRNSHAPAHTAPGGALSLSHMSPREAWMFCESLANTPLLPDAYRKQPASVLWAMEYGRALGLDVVTTITTIHVIKGKPTQSADLMLGRARAAGHRVRIKSERHRCEVRVQRADDPDDETYVEWTLDDAVTAGLCTLVDGRPYSRDQKNQPQPWEKFPRAMLRARALAEAVRIACPEVLHGAIYTPEELGAVVDQEGQPVIVERADVPQMTTATVVQSTPNTPPQQQADNDLSPQARQFLADAQAAPSPEAFAAVRARAEEAGAPPEFLAQLDRIAAEKQATTQKAPENETPTGPTPHSLADARDAQYDVPSAERNAIEADERARAEAESALRVAASRANLPTLDADFQRVYGLPIEQAPAMTLHAFRRQIEAAAGGAQ
ncbi:recombinase RecT [Streptomyces griseosporeus]|uniref:recombinase RecT n=1 Tax=Streptomyces griseosporeus TaxID=1910 RepID=UPI0036F4B855